MPVFFGFEAVRQALCRKKFPFFFIILSSFCVDFCRRSFSLSPRGQSWDIFSSSNFQQEPQRIRGRLGIKNSSSSLYNIIMWREKRRSRIVNSKSSAERRRRRTMEESNKRSKIGIDNDQYDNGRQSSYISHRSVIFCNFGIACL